MYKTLYIVIPCYNEQEVLPITFPIFAQKLESLIKQGLCSDKSKVLFVNDGSKDNTWQVITDICQKNKSFVGISLTCNRGHQNALLAGLIHAKDNECDVSISIDCDGQDDINAMDEFLRQYQEGCHIVYGVRSKRDTDTFFKRFTAESFYRFMKMMGVNIVFNHADYRLLSKEALEGLSQFKEVNLFLRGTVPLVGYKSTSVYYERKERIAGESHYPFSKMLNLALNGITSLSVQPLRYITNFGFFMSIISLIVLAYTLFTKLFGHTVEGWTSLVSIMVLMGGVQIFCLGVIGEYIGKIYSETKQRPKYIIETTTEDKDKEDKQ